MAIGAGYLLIAVFACGLVLAILLTFHLLEGWIDRVNQIRVYKIICSCGKESLRQ